VLQVNRAHHVHAVITKFLYLLPPVFIAAASGVIPREFVHQTNLRCPPEHRFDINGLSFSTAQRRNNLEFMDQIRDGIYSLRLNRGDHDVLATLLSPPSLIEHAERFSNARRITQKNL